jgi:hypothetical protein
MSEFEADWKSPAEPQTGANDPEQKSRNAPIGA